MYACSDCSCFCFELFVIDSVFVVLKIVWFVLISSCVDILQCLSFVANARIFFIFVLDFSDMLRSSQSG